MAVHVDPNYFLPIHFVLPLTFKGLDYKTGGLHIHKDDQVIDAEAKLSPGDVLFFNGGVPHEVVRVEGAGSQSSLGRLQMFSIPTEFEQGKPRRELLRALAFELYGRAKYTGYKLGLGFQSEHQNFR